LTIRSTDDRCSLRSLAADEPLAGTASTIRRWLLVSHDGPWGRDGLLDARLPDGVGWALRDLGRRTGTRVLLIRRNARNASREPDGRVVCFAIDTRDAWIGRRDLDRIEDAGALDPRDPRAFEGPGPDPVFVVCTHGRRDPCCAERGRPLAEAIAAAAPTTTWESTHVGGDRFAGNVIAFPRGFTFGRVDPAEAPALVGAHAEGRIAPLERYRGRTSEPFDVQAADAFLRIRLDLDRIADLRVRTRTRRGDASEVTFSTPIGDHRVRLERIAGRPMRLTCHSAREEVPWVWHPLASGPVEQGA
jgi:hypothetical protein